MPRGPRLDAPGTLHHVIVRGIEKRNIVDDDKDREDFVTRMGSIALDTETSIYAWALMTNHAHILLRSSTVGLPSVVAAASSVTVVPRAGNGTRTRDPNLGKVVLYQLSYSRMGQGGL